jgi:hypothetical protein
LARVVHEGREKKEKERKNRSERRKREKRKGEEEEKPWHHRVQVGIMSTSVVHEGLVGSY